MHRINIRNCVKWTTCTVVALYKAFYFQSTFAILNSYVSKDNISKNLLHFSFPKECSCYKQQRRKRLMTVLPSDLSLPNWLNKKKKFNTRYETKSYKNLQKRLPTSQYNQDWKPLRFLCPFLVPAKLQHMHDINFHKIPQMESRLRNRLYKKLPMRAVLDNDRLRLLHCNPQPSDSLLLLVNEMKFLRKLKCQCSQLTFLRPPGSLVVLRLAKLGKCKN